MGFMATRIRRLWKAKTRYRNDEEFLKELYDKHILNSDLNGTTMGALFWRTLRPFVNASDYVREVRGLQAEIFGLVCTHPATWDQRIIEVILTEVTFSHSYLAQLRRADIWDSMISYNLEIARTTEVIPLTFGLLEPSSEMNATLAEATRDHRDDILGFLTEKGLGPKLAERVGNRLLCKESDWENRLTAERLSLVLLQRLGCQKGLDDVIPVVQELYCSARKVLAEWLKV